MTWYHSIETLADTGYATKAEMTEHEGDVVNSFQWSGDGKGAGILIMRGDEHYIALVRSAFQNHPALRNNRSCTGTNTHTHSIGGPVATSEDQR